MNCDYSPYSLPTIDFVGGSTQELVFHTFFSQNKKPFDLSSCTASFALMSTGWWQVENFGWVACV